MEAHFCSYELKNLSCSICQEQPKKINNFYRVMSDSSEGFSGFEANFFEKLFPLEAKNFWFRSRNKLILWALEKFFSRATSFFEIGCGSGYVLNGLQKKIPEIKLYASDIYLEALGFAAQRLRNVCMFQMDATRIFFESQFELIGAFDVIEHIDQDGLALSEIYKALKPGGGVIITVPQHRFLWSKLDELAHHKRRYSRQELVSKVEAVGFRVVYKTSFVTFLLPLMFLSRCRQKKTAAVDAYSELKLNPVLNQLLVSIQTLEFFFIRMGCRFPFGGSLLLVAKKPIPS